MLSIVISMVVIVVLAGLVVTFVAFPHRGEEVPGASWLGDSMNRAVDVLPTLDNTSDDDEVAERGRAARRRRRLTGRSPGPGCLIGWRAWVTCST